MQQIHHSDLSQPVYEQLKQMILRNELEPGQKITQEKIAKQLGVSRTPLLKALQMLEYELLVESIPRRGVFVKKMKLPELIDVFDCRESLEGMAVKLFTQRCSSEQIAEISAIFEPFMNREIDREKYSKADEQFHHFIIEHSGNSMIKRLYFFGNIHTKVIQAGLVRAPQDTLSEHMDIVEAIKRKDPDKAEQLMRMHIHESRKMLASLTDKTIN